MSAPNLRVRFRFTKKGPNLNRTGPWPVYPHPNPRTPGPVTRSGLADPCHSLLTTDGCKDAFAGVLAQQIKTTLPGGKEVMHLHPIAFADGLPPRELHHQRRSTSCFC